MIRSNTCYSRYLFTCFVWLILMMVVTATKGQSSDETADHPFRPPQDPTVEVDVPRYDSTSSEHVLIRNNADWDRVNDSGVRVFFVTPGDYRDVGTISLTRSGSKKRPRWLVYYDPDKPGNDVHPYHMEAKKRALIKRVDLKGADHWRVDRLQFSQSSRIRDGSDHNILNRILVVQPGFDHGNDPLYIRGKSRHNTVQNSVIANSRFDSEEDVVGISIGNAPHTTIAGNEIFNMAGDAIQAGPPDVNEPGAIGTLITDNDLYITPRMYADGEGNRDRNGTYAGAENAIDVKQASVTKNHPIPPDKRMKIAYNRMWGFRRTDPAVGGTGSGGAHIVVHFEPASYVRIHHNVFFDGRSGYVVSKNEELGPIHNHFVHDNLFWDLSKRAMKPRHIDDARFQRNIVVDTNQFLSMWYDPPNTLPKRNRITRNVLVQVKKSGADSDKLNSKNEISENAYYASDPVGERGNDSLYFPNASDAKHESIHMKVKRITDPERITIPAANVTDRSPHASWFTDH